MCLRCDLCLCGCVLVYLYVSIVEVRVFMSVFESMNVPVDTCIFRSEHVWVCLGSMCVSAWCLGVLSEHLGVSM